MVAMCPNLWSLWGGHCTEKHICISKTLHEMRVEGEISEERERESSWTIRGKNVLKYSRMRIVVPN